MKENAVITVCYNVSEKWENREDAINFFTHAVSQSEGSEQSRYSIILSKLLSGTKLCTDEE